MWVEKKRRNLNIFNVLLFIFVLSHTQQFLGLTWLCYQGSLLVGFQEHRGGRDFKL